MNYISKSEYRIYAAVFAFEALAELIKGSLIPTIILGLIFVVSAYMAEFKS